MNLDLWNEFIQTEQDEESQGKGDEILNQEIIDQRYSFRIDVVGHDGAFFDAAVDGCPNGCYRKRDQHDDSDGEHDEIFYDSVIEEGFLVVGLEDEINGIDEVGEQETSSDERAEQSKPAQVCYVLG